MSESEPELVANSVQGSLDLLLVVRVGDVLVEVTDGVLAEGAQGTFILVVPRRLKGGHWEHGASCLAQADSLAHLVRLQIVGDHVDYLGDRSVR